MKLFALGLTAAVAAGAALSATPAAAGVVFEYNAGPAHFYRPPPPVIYRPAPVYYAPPPREVCRVTYVREWGPWGPRTRRVETCRDRW